ncbi:unnamed protein product, partial [Phaeothamnion confervicola]
MHAEDIVSVVEGVCRGLQTLHAHGIVHRDLSPSNVLLAAPTGLVAVVADLGVSTRLTPSRPATHHAAGAVAFMAPEVRRFLLGAPVAYGRPADVWAVGALIYAAAVGDAAPAALATESAEALATEVGRRTRCPGLQAAALAALHPAPSRRPSAAALGAMLARC